MRLVVFSDTHGDFFQALEVVKQNPNEKTFIFLGDGADELNLLKQQFPHKEFIGVCGNCDYFCDLPNVYMMDVSGVKILCTHGHLYNVKVSSALLMKAAKQKGATVVLHGHTHRSVSRYEDGVYLVCPGSVSRPADMKKSYATIDITDKGVFCNIVEMKN